MCSFVCTTYAIRFFVLIVKTFTIIGDRGHGFTCFNPITDIHKPLVVGWQWEALQDVRNPTLAHGRIGIVAADRIIPCAF